MSSANQFSKESWEQIRKQELTSPVRNMHLSWDVSLRQQIVRHIPRKIIKAMSHSPFEWFEAISHTA